MIQLRTVLKKQKRKRIQKKAEKPFSLSIENKKDLRPDGGGEGGRRCQVSSEFVLVCQKLHGNLRVAVLLFH